MTPETFKHQMADLIEEIGKDSMDYKDKMTCIGVTVFCLFAIMESLANDSIEAAKKAKEKGQN